LLLLPFFSSFDCSSPVPTSLPTHLSWRFVAQTRCPSSFFIPNFFFDRSHTRQYPQPVAFCPSGTPTPFPSSDDMLVTVPFRFPPFPCRWDDGRCSLSFDIPNLPQTASLRCVFSRFTPMQPLSPPPPAPFFFFRVPPPHHPPPPPPPHPPPPPPSNGRRNRTWPRPSLFRNRLFREQWLFRFHFSVPAFPLHFFFETELPSRRLHPPDSPPPTPQPPHADYGWSLLLAPPSFTFAKRFFSSTF